MTPLQRLRALPESWGLQPICPGMRCAEACLPTSLPSLSYCNTPTKPIVLQPAAPLTAPLQSASQPAGAWLPLLPLIDLVRGSVTQRCRRPAACRRGACATSSKPNSGGRSVQAAQAGRRLPGQGCRPSAAPFRPGSGSGSPGCRRPPGPSTAEGRGDSGRGCSAKQQATTLRGGTSKLSSNGSRRRRYHCLQPARSTVRTPLRIS